jgi:hypothetical protein
MRPAADSAADRVEPVRPGDDPLTRVLPHRWWVVEEHPWIHSANKRILPRPAELLIGAKIRKLAVVVGRIDGKP